MPRSSDLREERGSRRPIVGRSPTHLGGRSLGSTEQCNWAGLPMGQARHDSDGPERPIRVYVVDDHGVVRRGMRAYLEMIGVLPVRSRKADVNSGSRSSSCSCMTRRWPAPAPRSTTYERRRGQDLMAVPDSEMRQPIAAYRRAQKTWFAATARRVPV